jgi:hypothetical protein
MVSPSPASSNCGFQVMPRSRVPLSAARKVTAASKAGAAISGGSHPGDQSAGSAHGPRSVVRTGAARCASIHNGPSMT